MGQPELPQAVEDRFCLRVVAGQRGDDHHTVALAFGNGAAGGVGLHAPAVAAWVGCEPAAFPDVVVVGDVLVELVARVIVGSEGSRAVRLMLNAEGELLGLSGRRGEARRSRQKGEGQQVAATITMP